MKKIHYSHILQTFALIPTVMVLASCTSEPVPTEAELNKARYDRCKAIVKDIYDLFQTAKIEGNMDANDARLVKVRDAYNLEGCNDWIWPELK